MCAKGYRLIPMRKDTGRNRSDLLIAVIQLITAIFAALPVLLHTVW